MKITGGSTEGDRGVELGQLAEYDRIHFCDVPSGVDINYDMLYKISKQICTSKGI